MGSGYASQKVLAVLQEGLNNPPTMDLQTSDTPPQLSFEVEPADDKPKADWRQEVPTVSQLTRRVRRHVRTPFLMSGSVAKFQT